MHKLCHRPESFYSRVSGTTRSGVLVLSHLGRGQRGRKAEAMKQIQAELSLVRAPFPGVPNFQLPPKPPKPMLWGWLLVEKARRKVEQ